MGESIPAGEVVKIDPDGKYVLVFPMRLLDEEIDRYTETLDNWWSGDSASPFLLIDGGVQVVRLDRDGEEKIEVEGDAKTKAKAKVETKGKTKAKTKAKEKG